MRYAGLGPEVQVRHTCMSTCKLEVPTRTTAVTVKQTRNGHSRDGCTMDLHPRILREGRKREGPAPRRPRRLVSLLRVCGGVSSYLGGEGRQYGHTAHVHTMDGKGRQYGHTAHSLHTMDGEGRQYGHTAHSLHTMDGEGRQYGHTAHVHTMDGEGRQYGHTAHPLHTMGGEGRQYTHTAHGHTMDGEGRQYCTRTHNEQLNIL